MALAHDRKDLQPLCNVNVLKTKRILLVQNIIFENVMPSIEPFLLYRQVDEIRSEKTKIDRIGKILDVLERFTSGKRYEAFDAFILSLAGTQPDLFQTLCQRPPTVSESEFCVKVASLEIKQSIGKTEHHTDSQLDEQIDFEYEYVELATDRGIRYEDLPHQYSQHLDNVHALGQNISPYDWLLGNAEEEYKKVSIYGRAGIGKSTTMQFFAKQWALGRWAAGFTMLFLLQLRFITTQVIAISTVELLQIYGLYEFPDRFESTPFTSWLRNSAAKVLLMIDGLDEIPGFAERMQNTPKIHDILQKAHPIDLCINLLRGDLLPGCTVISASRPFAGLSQLPADARAEILGLTTSKVTEYVERRHPSHVENIMSVLKKNPILLSVCGITFYCMMITRLLSDGVSVLDEDVKTYTRLMSFIIIQYCSRKIHDSSFSIEVSSYFSKLSQLAYSGIFHLEENEGLSKLVFNDADLAKANITQQDLDNIKKTGILQITRRKIGRLESWTAVSFHLSAQELLSVAHLLSHPQISSFIVKMFDTGQFNLALRFLFGLHLDKKNNWVKQISTVASSSTRDHDCDIDASLSLLIDRRSGGAVNYNKLEICQLIYEGQWDEKAKDLGSQIAPGGRLYIQYTTMSAIDLLAVDFVCQSLSSVTLSFINADDNFVDVLLSSMCTHHCKTLREVDLENNKIRAPGAEAIAEHFLMHKKLNVRVLNLAKNRIGDTGVVALSRLLASSEGLQDLNVCDNQIQEQGVIALASGLIDNTGLKKLKFNYRDVEGFGAKALAEMLEKNSCLEELDLGFSLFGNNGIRLMVSGLHKNRTLTKLCLRKSGIDDQGAVAIAAMLPHVYNTGLQTLDISDNQITDVGAQAIADSLVSNTSLTELNISNQRGCMEKRLGDDGAVALADKLLQNFSLIALLSYGNHIADKGAIQMAKMLLHNTSLKTLNISCNDVGDRGAMAIASAFCSTEDAGIRLEQTKVSQPAAESTGEAGEGTPLLSHTREQEVEVRRWICFPCLPSLCGAEPEENTVQCNIREGTGSDLTLPSISTAEPELNIEGCNIREGTGLDLGHYNTTLKKLHIHGRLVGAACAKFLMNIRPHDTNLDVYV